MLTRTSAYLRGRPPIEGAQGRPATACRSAPPVLLQPAPPACATTARPAYTTTAACLAYCSTWPAARQRVHCSSCATSYCTARAATAARLPLQLVCHQLLLQHGLLLMQPALATAGSTAATAARVPANADSTCAPQQHVQSLPHCVPQHVCSTAALRTADSTCAPQQHYVLQTARAAQQHEQHQLLHTHRERPEGAEQRPTESPPGE